MKIYTGTGDKGKTGLFSGERVLKCDDRISAYGDVDELNSVLGIIVSSLAHGGAEDLSMDIDRIQKDLFHLSSWLATGNPEDFDRSLKPFEHSHSVALEKRMDEMDAALPPLRNFILPGGHLTAAYAHLARTVCRRAERSVIKLLERESLTHHASYGHILVYLNRLSDFLFLFSRLVNQRLGYPDVQWQGE